MKNALFISLLFLTNCVTLTPMGRDSYMVEAKQPIGKLIRLANEECIEQGRVAVIRRYWSPGMDVNTPGHVIFSCVTENDPENRRPDMHTDPSMTIQNSIQNR